MGIEYRGDMEIKTLYGLNKKGGFKVWSIWTDSIEMWIGHGGQHN